MKIAKFLGRDYLKVLLADEGKLLKEILIKTSFKYMAEKPNSEWVYFFSFPIFILFES